jgi:hypothetical protein
VRKRLEVSVLELCRTMLVVQIKAPTVTGINQLYSALLSNDPHSPIDQFSFK